MIAGCVSADHALVNKSPVSDAALDRGDDALDHYRVDCPDVLEIEIARRREFTGHYIVEPDGRIQLGRYGRLSVQNLTLHEIVRRLAQTAGVPASSVRVRVAQFRSQQIVLIGQVVGWQRTVPYQGPERVLELLQRVGGITSEAAPEEVFVVRAHLGEGRPEVFHVKLAAILNDHDDRSNIFVRPSDHIYVGETRQAKIEKCIPQWIRPLYQALWDLQPTDAGLRDNRPMPSRWVVGRPANGPVLRHP
jgi:protein involved in polysaccharide export with SLBB domain